MKKRIPERDVDACDFCTVAGVYLQECVVCGREFCLTCEGRVLASGGFTTLCRECVSRSDVIKLCEDFAKQLRPIYEGRQMALAELPRKQS